MTPVGSTGEQREREAPMVDEKRSAELQAAEVLGDIGVGPGRTGIVVVEETSPRRSCINRNT